MISGVNKRHAMTPAKHKASGCLAFVTPATGSSIRWISTRAYGLGFGFGGGAIGEPEADRHCRARSNYRIEPDKHRVTAARPELDGAASGYVNMIERGHAGHALHAAHTLVHLRLGCERAFHPDQHFVAPTAPNGEVSRRGLARDCRQADPCFAYPWLRAALVAPVYQKRDQQPEEPAFHFA